MKVLIVSADNFEDSELLFPLYRVKEEGGEVQIASLEKKNIKGKRGYEVPVDTTFQEVNPEEYDLLIIPGGKAPAEIRKDPHALAIVHHFFEHRKPVAAICHGPQVIISAGLAQGRRMTAYRTVVEELKEAGALYEDREVVVDENLITSRQPSDLPFFMREIVKKLKNLH